MKNAISTLFILITIFTNYAYGIPISANVNFTTPRSVTNPISLNADFGINSNDYNIDNLELVVAFNNNILDPQETFSILYLDNQLSGVFQLTLGLFPRDSIFFDLSNLYINDIGISEFTISSSGNGVNVTDISLSGNATAVPEPPTNLLLLLGLLFIFNKKHKALTSMEIKPYN